MKRYYTALAFFLLISTNVAKASSCRGSGSSEDCSGSTSGSGEVDPRGIEKLVELIPRSRSRHRGEPQDVVEYLDVDKVAKTLARLQKLRRHRGRHRDADANRNSNSNVNTNINTIGENDRGRGGRMRPDRSGHYNPTRRFLVPANAVGKPQSVRDSVNHRHLPRFMKYFNMTTDQLKKSKNMKRLNYHLIRMNSNEQDHLVKYLLSERKRNVFFKWADYTLAAIRKGQKGWILTIDLERKVPASIALRTVHLNKTSKAKTSTKATTATKKPTASVKPTTKPGLVNVHVRKPINQTRRSSGHHQRDRQRNSNVNENRNTNVNVIQDALSSDIENDYELDHDRRDRKRQKFKPGRRSAHDIYDGDDVDDLNTNRNVNTNINTNTYHRTPYRSRYDDFKDYESEPEGELQTRRRGRWGGGMGKFLSHADRLSHVIDTGMQVGGAIYDAAQNG